MRGLGGYLAFFALMGLMYAFVLGVNRLLGHLFGAAGGLLRIGRIDRQLLADSLPYYANLPAARKKGFERRVQDFINDKDFHGRGLEVTREMKLMIAGAAVQVTFGLEPLLLMHFTRILVYPDRYRNRLQTRDHIGEVNPGMQVIAVSWKHFLEGFATATDARNVGLHEMAHAMWFENRIPNAEDDFLDPEVLKQWRGLAKDEAERIDRGEDRLFRTYASTDQAEFFAVAVEYFFEQPREYRERLPELYACMVRLLKQDPAAAAPMRAGASIGPA